MGDRISFSYTILSHNDTKQDLVVLESNPIVLFNVVFANIPHTGNWLLPSSAKPQLQLQFCWLAELALILVNPATHPPPPPRKVYLVAVAN